MREKNPFPIINCQLEELICMYIENKIINCPRLFGLESFSEEDLLSNYFDKEGDDKFFIFEKNYRLIDTEIYINFKIYYIGNTLNSNGISVSRGPFVDVLKKISRRLKTVRSVYSLELLLDNSLNYGSIIVNNLIDIKFGKIGRGMDRKKFHLLGISTDYGFVENWEVKAINTHGARLMKDGVSFVDAQVKYKYNSSILGVIGALMENFPGAIFI